MENRIFENIRNYGLIEAGDNIVIGVSGGHDSMALLNVLYNYRKEVDYNLIVAHVNHDVRGDDALRDELFVENMAKKLGLEYYSKKVNMIQYGIDHGISDEEAGREIRYSFFNEIIANKGGGKIALAHNKNDQAETLLMRIIRGTGIDGLKGMSYEYSNIIRPMLNISRDEVEDYIDVNEIPTVLDETNLESIYTRNRIRLEVIPYIEEYFNPNLVDALWRLSENSEIDNEFLNMKSNEVLDDLIISEGKDKVEIEREGFLDLHQALQNRVIRELINRINGDLQGYSEKNIRDIIDLVKQGDSGKELHLPNKIVVRLDYNIIRLEINNKMEIKDFEYKLAVGENYIDILDITVKISIMDIVLASNLIKTEYMNIFDYDKIKGNLYLRNRRNGDRFAPLGMKGTKKIKDYFIDEKVSKADRDEIPLLLDNENILWVMGYRMSDLYKVTKNTKQALVVEYF